MPARIFLAIAAFLFAGTGAQQPPVDIDPPLWVVRDADTTVYLFGSIHWLKPGLGWFDDAVRDAFDSSDTLVLETVSVDAATARRVQDAAGTLADGPPLPDRLPAEYRPKLAAAIAEQGYPAGAFDRTKPWLAATTLSTLPLRRAGYDPALGVETVLTNAAAAAGKPVTGLEERAQQLGYFDSLPDAAQIAMLKTQLDGMDRATTSTDEVLEAWSRGDVGALGRIVARDQQASSAAFTDSVITQRNRRWAGWIADRMRRPGVVFMAVGVGHLTGDYTVQRELARRGVKVERVVLKELPSLEGRGWGWVGRLAGVAVPRGPTHPQPLPSREGRNLDLTLLPLAGEERDLGSRLRPLVAAVRVLVARGTEEEEGPHPTLSRRRERAYTLPPPLQSAMRARSVAGSSLEACPVILNSTYFGDPT